MNLAATLWPWVLAAGVMAFGAAVLVNSEQRWKLARSSHDWLPVEGVIVESHVDDRPSQAQAFFDLRYEYEVDGSQYSGG